MVGMDPACHATASKDEDKLNSVKGSSKGSRKFAHVESRLNIKSTGRNEDTSRVTSRSAASKPFLRRSASLN